MKFCYNTNFTLPKQKDIDPSCKMDLDLWDCFGREKTSSYNRRNTVCLKAADGIADSADLDQNTPSGTVQSRSAQSDLDLHCLLRPICSNI